jgi:hypothetical protein
MRDNGVVQKYERGEPPRHHGRNGGITVDPQSFDRMIQHLSQARSRRSLMGGSLGAGVLATVGLGDEAQARTVSTDGAARAEACIPSGKMCPSRKPRGKHGKTLSCNDCCEDFSVPYRTRKGKQVRRCACKPVGQPATTPQQWQCCSGVSDGAVCAGTAPVTGQPPPPTPPTCTDGIRNGSETDTDCGGGTCPRCRTFERCATRDDCTGALCTDGTCRACATAPECGTDARGGCFCDRPEGSATRVCTTGPRSAGPFTDCAPCAADTFCVQTSAGEFSCFKPCGAP